MSTPGARLALLSLLVAAPTFAQTLVVDGTNSPFTIAAAATYDQLTVAAGGTLVVNAPLTVRNDLAVQAGGRVTVDFSVKTLALEVLGTLTVASGGLVDADGKGLPGGNVSSPYGVRSGTIDPVAGVMVIGSNEAAGGSHCGTGGIGVNNTPAPARYDDVRAPKHPGGGGGARGVTGLGGAGGGVIRLTAKSLVLDGSLTASGLNSPASTEWGGGGAGGSLDVKVEQLAGAGSFVARGGENFNGGSGGGGCIRVAYASSTFGGSFSAAGGTGASAGMVGVHDTAANDLHVVTATYELKGGDAYRAIQLNTGTTLTVLGRADVTLPLVVPAGARVNLRNTRALDALSIASVDGTLSVEAPVVARRALTLGGTLIVDQTFTVPQLDVEAGGVVTHTAQLNTMHLVVPGTLRIASGGQLAATGLGYPGGKVGEFPGMATTLDPVTFARAPGSGPRNGGSHGGFGGRPDPAAALAATFDDPMNPRFPGGGGGQSPSINCGTWSGGAGGGVLRVTARVLQLNGSVHANGGAAEFASNCSHRAGGGAGGSVILSADELSGTGGIYARGGNSDGIVPISGGGGGGLVNVSYGASTFTGIVGVEGGVGAPEAGVGVYIQNPSGIGAKVASLPLAQAVVGRPYAYRALATGTRPFTWKLVSGPTGAAMLANGELHWTPSTPGVFPVTLEVSNAAGAERQSFDLEVTTNPFGGGAGAGPTFISTPDSVAYCGVPYRYSSLGRPLVEGDGPFTFSIHPLLGSELPGGLTVNATTGELSWIPSRDEARTFPMELVVNGASGTARQPFMVTVECPQARDLQSGCACGSTGGSLFVLAAGWWLVSLAQGKRTRRSRAR